MSDDAIPLHRILIDSDPGGTVVWTPERTFDWDTVLTRVSGLSQELSDRSPDRWTLVCENSRAFLVGLLATWHAGDIAVLPPNTESEMVRGTAKDTGGILTDQDDLLSVTDVGLTPLDHEGDPGSLGELDPERVSTEMMTSGSTGERKVIPKTLRNFWADVGCYDDLWGNEVGDSIAFSHVSHQHIFGLIFKVLWPIVEGRAFYPETPVYPGDLSNLLDQVSDAYLISSPSPLERLVRSGELASMVGTLNAVFSGGGEIDVDVAEAIHETFGFYPFSVFGSTECGGIAWRRRDPNKDHPGWNRIPGVDININETGELFVRSDAVSDNLEEWYPTGDLAEEHEDGQFDLKGRADRVIKIAEKRVSLPQIEAKLSQSPHVEAAVTTLVEEAGDGSRKTELGAAIELSEEGKAALEDQSREELRTELRNSLKDFVADVALPREWRFREELPRDHMSKISHDTVQELFEDGS